MQDGLVKGLNNIAPSQDRLRDVVTKIKIVDRTT